MKPRTPRPWMTTGEVALLFNVSGPTVRRWAEAGKLTTAKTLGGDRRYHREQVEQLARENGILPWPAKKSS